MKISALILTHNEAAHIQTCLDSLSAVEKIVIVDSGSTDGTLELVAQCGRPVTLIERPFHSFSDQRNYAMEHVFTEGEWVLHLDADERLKGPLAAEIAALPDEGYTAYNIPSLTFFRRRPIPRASGYPVYQTRLTRAGQFRFVEVGHGQKAPPEMGDIPRLKQPYEHHPLDNGMSAWVARHDRYSTREAEDWLQNAARYTWQAAVSNPVARRQWLKQISRRVPFAPSMVYFYLLIIRRGFMDGVEGRDYCRMRFIYENLISLKVNERLRAGSTN